MCAYAIVHVDKWIEMTTELTCYWQQIVCSYEVSMKKDSLQCLTFVSIPVSFYATSLWTGMLMQMKAIKISCSRT